MKKQNKLLSILDILYSEYYLNYKFSTVTSSHWRRFGESQKMIKCSSGYKLKGEGFGNFIDNKWYKKLFSLPTFLFIKIMLRHSNKETIKAAKKISQLMDATFSYDVARIVLTVDILVKNIGDLSGKKIAIIGDGYGSLGSVLKLIYPSCQILYINLGRTLAFDAYYTGLCFPSLTHQLLTEVNFDKLSDFYYLPAEKLSSVNINADLFISIASMQEMDLQTINQYFDLIYSQNEDTLFYCCNRIEKMLPDGSTTRFDDYGWRLKDDVLVNELCPWYQTFPQNRPPFIARFDGPIVHRLIKVNKS